MIAGQGVLVPAFCRLAQGQADLIEIILDADQLQRVAVVAVHNLGLESLQAAHLVESEAEIDGHSNQRHPEPEKLRHQSCAACHVGILS